MSKQPLMYWIEVGGRRWRLREIRGTELIAKPFRLEAMFLLEPGQRFSPADSLAKDATIELVRGGVVRHIDGIITWADVEAKRTGAGEVRVVVEPRLVLARERVDIRLFREKTAPEIVVEVLSALGIETELRLAKDYERRHYCVQMRESDFDFVNRLLEDEGIFYYFREGDVMVLGDTPAAYEPIPGNPVLPFHTGFGMDRNEDAVVAVGARARLAPGKVTLRDFNPEKPSLDMQVETKGPWEGGPEWYDYPGEYLEPGDGQRKAKLRAEAMACARAALRGKSFCGRMLPGATFTLTGAPSPVESRGYVITRVDHDWDRDRSGFSNAFEALGDDVAFRPMPDTYVPTLLNPLTGFITGPPGEDDIYTDEWGRVKVHLHWDRLFPRDDSCSYWVPVLQDNTGKSVAIPRIGWEVMVHFLEGDPDRPIVLGRVYNAEDTFPYDLPMHKTRTALKSLSSPRERNPRDSGTNFIELEDRAGIERFHYHAQRDKMVYVANEKKEEVLSHETRRIQRDETISIAGSQFVSVTSDVLPGVNGNQTWSVGGDRTLTHAGAFNATVQGNRSVTIGANHEITLGGTARTFVEKNLTETIAANVLSECKENDLYTGYESTELTVGGSIIEIAAEGKSEQTNLSREEKVAGSVLIDAGMKIATRVGAPRETTIGGSLSAAAAQYVTLAGVEGLQTQSATGNLSGAARLVLKVGDTTIRLEGGVIAVKSKEGINITSAGANVQGHGSSDQI